MKTLEESEAFEAWRETQIESLRRTGHEMAADAFRNLGSIQWAGWQARAAISGPQLAVWHGPMPESNGRMNYTVLLHRKGEPAYEGICVDRQEYPGRSQYEADAFRHLIGELECKPCPTQYDSEAHSGYKPPSTADQKAISALQEQLNVLRKGVLGRYDGPGLLAIVRGLKQEAIGNGNVSATDLDAAAEALEYMVELAAGEEP